ncbi:M60 family metallopeptidase [Pseudomonas sp. NPDC090592]|uniref:M60 family metallopeptidase n=1 Tax=Pseudomonas sp. NPDC090592 TaxID=3364480 RepID=UPI00383A5568
MELNALLDEVRARITDLSESMEFPIMPSADADRRRYGRWRKYADFQPTGIFIEPNGTVEFDLVLPRTSEVEVQVWVGTPGFNVSGSEEEDLRIYDVTSTSGTVTDLQGGLLWLRVVSDEPSARSKVAQFVPTRLDRAKKIPVFVQGKTSPLLWPLILFFFEDLGERSPVQFVNDKVVITAWRSTAVEFVTHNPSEVLDEYENILRVEDEMAAIGTGSGQILPSPLRILVSEKEQGIPDAANYRISLPQYGRSLLTAAGVRGDWGVWHEFGHMQQQIAWSAKALTENSVNIFSLAAQRALKQYSRVAPYNLQAHAFLDNPDPNKKFEDLGDFVRLIMWEQLRVAYGDEFFHRLHHEARTNGISDTGQGDAQYRHYFMVTSSLAARHDLTTFFTRWGLHPTERTLTAIRDLRLPQPTPDPSTLHIKAETQIDIAATHSGSFVIIGTARPRSRLKTTNDPKQGWFDPEGGITYARRAGEFVVVTNRTVNGKCVVKSYDPDTGEALGESNHVSPVLDDDTLQSCHCTELTDDH